MGDSPYLQKYAEAFSAIQAYALDQNPDKPLSDAETGEIMQLLSAGEIERTAVTGILVDKARDALAPPNVPNVARPRGPIPSTRVAGKLGNIGNIYALTQTLPDIAKVARERVNTAKRGVESVREFGQSVIDELLDASGNGGSKLGIRVGTGSAFAGADARYMDATSGSMDYKSGPLISMNSPVYLQPGEISTQLVVDSSTHFLSGSGGHFETPLLLQVVNWCPSWRDIEYGTKQQSQPDPRDYLGFVVSEVFYILNTIELQTSVNFKLSNDWSEVNLYSYILTVLDAMQIVVDVNVVRIGYVEGKELNEGLNQLASLLTNDELLLLDALGIKLEQTYLPSQLSQYFWTISQLYTLEGVTDSTVCKFIGTHAVCEDPKTRVANIQELLDRTRQPWFIGIQTLFSQCDKKGEMLQAWQQIGSIPFGTGIPVYSGEFTWLWANNAVCYQTAPGSDPHWLPTVSDIDHSAYAQTRLDEMDLLYLLSAPIPYVSPGDNKLHTHFNAIMLPHPVGTKASAGKGSCSILHSGLNGLEIISPSGTSQPITGNINLSGINNGTLPTPTVYPGWKRLNYYSITHRDQYMLQFLNVILKGFGSDKPGAVNPDTPLSTRSGGRGNGRNNNPRNPKPKKEEPVVEFQGSEITGADRTRVTPKGKES
jgi:hypothetical protein